MNYLLIGRPNVGKSSIYNLLTGNNNIIHKLKGTTRDWHKDKIKITMDNLMVTKNKGLAAGVSNIFIENMKKLSLYERPMHCTDS